MRVVPALVILGILINELPMVQEMLVLMALKTIQNLNTYTGARVKKNGSNPFKDAFLLKCLSYSNFMHDAHLRSAEP